MSAAIRVLILGASYGSLPGTKLQLAGHPTTLVCSAPTALLINDIGSEVRLPVGNSEVPLSILSRDCLTELRAATPEAVDPAEYDLAILAIQEKHCRTAGMKGLLERIARARLPTVAMMDMPPPPYLLRLGIDCDALAPWYHDFQFWSAFDPALLTMASPHAQAYRPKPESRNVLQVQHARDFLVAEFADPQHTRLLTRLQRDIDAIRYHGPQGESVALPVGLALVNTPAAVLAHWSALFTGHYRSVGQELMRPINETVHGDIDESRRAFVWVNELLQHLGADPQELQDFTDFADAVVGWRSPSITARALAAGATTVDRVDGVLQSLAARFGMQLDLLDQNVALIDRWLQSNRERLRPASRHAD